MFLMFVEIKVKLIQENINHLLEYPMQLSLNSYTFNLCTTYKKSVICIKSSFTLDQGDSKLFYEFFILDN